MKKKEIISIFISVFLIGCSIVNPREKDDAALKIRSINISVIIEYMINSEPVTKALRDRKNHLLKSISEIDNKLVDLIDENKRESIRVVQERYRTELHKINNKGNDFKSRILKEIDRALRKLSNERNIDFILNIGEGAVFSASEYDITEEVIREIVRLRKRNSPVSR